MTPVPSHTLRLPALGFGLAEVLVGMLIGMIGAIVMFQVFAVSESINRTTTSGGDAQQAGAAGLFSIERDLRQAGYGINTSTDLGCAVSAYDGNTAANFAMTLTPVTITSNAGTVPDSLQILYGNPAMVNNPVALSANQIGADTALVRVGNRYGFALSDLIVLTEQTAPARCMLAEVTALPMNLPPATPGPTPELFHDAGDYVNADGVNVTARYNRPGGHGLVPFTTNARVYNLGQRLTLNTYAIVNHEMTVSAFNTAGAPPAIAEDIVMFKAQYGMDNGVNNGTVTGPTGADDGVIDQFSGTSPTTAVGWARVIAVRIALVARSTLRERPSASATGCDTSPGTPLAPNWAATGPLVWKTAGYAGVVLDLTADPNWQCYRYKIFETTVPLRNQIWRQP